MHFNRKAIRSRLKNSAFIIAVLLLGGCSDVFNITPYDTAPADGPRSQTDRNIALWKARSGEAPGPVTIAITSDPHFYFGDLSDIVEHINADASIDVVIVPGDLTDQATLREFQWFNDIMIRSNKPWLATIGNHDHQSNGRQIYEQMYGARNFVADIKGFRFIFFDDTVWESDTPPDVGWLANALEGAGNSIPVVITHIPPQNDQLADGYGAQIRELMAVHEVDLFIHGHLHAYADYQLPDHDTRYICIPWPRERSYVRMHLDQDEVQIDLITL